jgi:uncharacterized protein YciI
MKLILFLFAMAAFATSVFAQEHSDPAAKTGYFIAFYTPGSAWSKGKPANEQKNFTEHSTHLSELRQKNKIDIGGRYENSMMLIVRAKSEEEAKSFLEDDPAVKNKLFKIEVHAFNPFFNGCVR